MFSPDIWKAYLYGCQLFFSPLHHFLHTTYAKFSWEHACESSHSPRLKIRIRWNVTCNSPSHAPLQVGELIQVLFHFKKVNEWWGWPLSCGGGCSLLFYSLCCARSFLPLQSGFSPLRCCPVFYAGDGLWCIILKTQWVASFPFECYVVGGDHHNGLQWCIIITCETS